jgi:phage-related minor tail protein
MAEYEAEIERLDVQLEGLENTLSGAADMSAEFQRELSGIREGISGAGREAAGFSRSLGTDMRSAFGDLVFEGAKVSDVLRDIGRSMIETTLNSAIKPVTNAVSGGLTDLITNLLPFEKGGVFSNGNVTPFAKGGVVSSPTSFAMRNGTGLMGEAGPEAIMPLARGADGSLGVRGGGSTVTVNMNIQTPDVAGFKRSSSQIASGIQRAIARGQRNN